MATSEIIRFARPLPKGSVISYCGEVVTVVEDQGDTRIVVNDGVDTINWFWTFEGECCKIHSVPA